MNCPNCNIINNDQDRFCRNCGFDLQNLQQLNNNIRNLSGNTDNLRINDLNTKNNNIYNNVTEVPLKTEVNITNNNIEQELQLENILIDAYIGNNASQLKDGSFSWCTAFFGVLYIAYRKMWKFALILEIIYISIILILSKYTLLQNLLLFIICLIVSFMFKDKYLKYVVSNVRKIIRDNPNKSPEELIKICKKKGGKSILYIIGFILGTYIIIYAISFLLIFIALLFN